MNRTVPHAQGAVRASLVVYKGASRCKSEGGLGLFVDTRGAHHLKIDDVKLIDWCMCVWVVQYVTFSLASS